VQMTLARLPKLFIRTMACALSALALAACSSSSDDSGGGPVTTASAGVDQSVLENTVVTLNGSGTSAGGTLTYVWSQTGGQMVTINNANMAVANFMAPDVTLGAPENLTFQLTVSDGTTLDVDSVIVSVQEPQPTVTVSGVVQYEFVNALANCRDLDFSSIDIRPIRGATVQLVDTASGAILQTTISSPTGDYSFSNVDTNIMVRVQVRAELMRGGIPIVEVRDNFLPGASDTDIPPPPPQGTRALYVLVGTDFNTGGVDVVRNPTATTGWDGASYSGTRAAAPFSILDAIYSGVELVASADPTAVFPPMDAFWSVNNTQGATFDVAAGQMPTSFYSSGADSLYLLGDASYDTEEFDDHVIMHEWGHYFEDNFSRSDSTGGPHTLGQSLDARLAWGEGWATAFGAMALNDPLYCDTRAIGSNGGFSLNVEVDGFGIQGWFNEVSVATLLYDLFDIAPDGTDNDSIGFGPIYDTMSGPQRFTPAFTTIHTFAAELRPMLNVTAQAFLDSQLEREFVNSPDESTVDIWASTEGNDRNGARDALPLYTDYTADGSTMNICVNNDLDNEVGGNKLAEYRYLRLTIPTTDTYNVVIDATTIPTPTADATDRDQSDPDMYIQVDGAIVAFGLSPDENNETFTTQSTLLTGFTYIADIHDWRFEDVDGAPPGYPDTPNSNMCFDITMTATP
jgi:K319L-like, PKD domain